MPTESGERLLTKICESFNVGSEDQELVGLYKLLDTSLVQLQLADRDAKVLKAELQCDGTRPGKQLISGNRPVYLMPNVS